MGSWRKILYGGSSDASNSGNITAVDLATSPSSNKFLKTDSSGNLSWSSTNLSGDTAFTRLGIKGDVGSLFNAYYVGDRMNTGSTITDFVDSTNTPSNYSEPTYVDSNSIYRYDAVFCFASTGAGGFILSHGLSTGDAIWHKGFDFSTANGLFYVEKLNNHFYVIRTQSNSEASTNEEPYDIDDNGNDIVDSANIKAWSFDSGDVVSQYDVHELSPSETPGYYVNNISWMEDKDLLHIRGTTDQVSVDTSDIIFPSIDSGYSGPSLILSLPQDIATGSNVSFGSLAVSKNSTIKLAKSGSDIPSLQNPSNTDNLVLSAPAGNAIIDLSASSIELSNTLSIKNTTNKISLSIDANMSSDLSFILPTADGADGDLLTTDGSGNLSWYTLGSDVINIGTTNLTASGARTFTIVDDTASSFSIGSTTSANLLKFNTSTDTLSIDGNFIASGNGSYSGNLTLLDDNNNSRQLNGNSITTGGDSGVTMYLLTGGGTYSKVLVADSSTGAPKWDWITGNNIGGNTIGLSSLVNIATNSFIGRDAAGTGSPGVLNATDARAILGVADGAEANVQSDWDETDTNDDAHILNKPTVYYTSAIPDATATQTGLATSTQITKLDGIDEDADVNPTIIVSDDLTGHSDTNVPSTSAIKSYVDDTKVPLAGDVTITGDIHMDDGIKVEFGTGTEYITGDGTDLTIKSNGHLNFDLQNTNNSMVQFDGARVTGVGKIIFSDNSVLSGLKDEDDMYSDSNGYGATQKSIKAYVDNTIRDIRASGFNYQPQVGTKVYIPLGATTSESTILAGGNEWRHFVVPFDGYLDQVIIRSEEACGSTDVALHKSSTGTEVPSSTASATVTVDMTTDDTAYKFDFTSNNTFSAGDIIAISFDPTNDSNDTNATVVLVYDGSQGV